MSITELAIKKPVANLMLLLLLVFLGIMTYNKIETTLLPDFSFEFLFIYATLDNTPPRTMVSMVTQPIEEAVKMLPSTVNVRSRTGQNDTSIFIQLSSGTNVLVAKNTLEDNISRMNLPADTQFFVYHFDPQDIPILSINIGTGIDLEKTKYLVDNIIKPELERIPGVGRIDLQGGFDREIVIRLKKDSLEKHNITIGTVTAALFSENIQQKGGTIKSGSRETVVKVNSKLESLQDIENIVVKTFPNSKALLIKDIGYVSEDFENRDYIYKFNGKDAFLIDVLKKSSANTLEVSENVKLKTAEFEKRFNLKLTYFNDASETIKSVLNTIKSDLLKGLFFACLVLLIFLRSFRSIFTIVIAIPICIIITFIPMYFTGVNINLISLLGFALVSGMLVDNSIIIMENIHRYRIMGHSPTQASMLAVLEVKRPIFASTLTTIAVFFPIFLIGGLASRIFEDLSFTAIFSLAASYFVAMSIVPMIIANFYLESRPEPGFKIINRIFDSLPFRLTGRLFKEGYEKGNLLIQKKWYTRLLFIAFIIISLIAGFIYNSLRGESDDIVDQTYLRINVEAVQGTKMSEMERIVLAIESFLSKNVPEIKDVSSVSFTGRGRLYLILHKKDEFQSEFPGKPYRTVDDISRLVFDEFNGMPGIRIESSIRSHGRGGMDASKNIVSIEGKDIDYLRELSEKAVEALQGIESLYEVNPDYGIVGSEIVVHPNREKLESLGLSSQDIAMIILRELGSDIATEIFTDGVKKKIRLTVDYQQAKDIETLKNIKINMPNNIQVALEEFIDIGIEAQSPRIIRENSKFVSFIEFKVDKDIPMTKIMEDITNSKKTGILDRIILPPGYSFSWGGRMMAFQESMSDMYVFFIAGLILVFMIMSAEFESLFHPFVIIFTVPVAIFGGILSLNILGINFSENAAMGLVIIIGIVVNDAIILIDFINQERRRGKDRVDAIISAGLVRMRPIFMTTLTTVGAMLPLLFGFEEGSEYKRPMAGIIIGGLSFASFLTLFFIPALYSFFEDIVELLKFLMLRIKVSLKT